MNTPAKATTQVNWHHVHYVVEHIEEIDDTKLIVNDIAQAHDSYNIMQAISIEE